jgi:hypothetical protein
MVVLGIVIVSGGETNMQIHLEVAMLRSYLPQEGIGDVSLLGVISHNIML